MPDSNFVASLLFKVSWTEISTEKYEEQVVMESGSSRDEVIHKLKQYGINEEDELEEEAPMVEDGGASLMQALSSLK